MVAKITFASGERAITYAEVEAYAAKVKETEKISFPDTFEDLTALLLLADEAKRNGASDPDEVKLGDEWAKKSIGPEAEAAVTDADLAAAFAERRSAVRVMFKTQDEAAALRAELLAPDGAFMKSADMAGKTTVFKTKNGKNEKISARLEEKGIAPTGVLFDPQGRGDNGQAVVPPRIAEAAFKLAADGDITEPFELAPGRWALVMRTGTRPGTPIDQVPADVRQRTREGLVATRGVNLMRDRVARLRRDAPVAVVDEAAIAKALGVSRDASRMSKLRRIPNDIRKQRMNSGMRGPRERTPGLEPRDVPRPEQLTPEKAHEGMPKEGQPK